MTTRTSYRWLPIRDADPRAIGIYRRHYSADRRNNHHAGIGGPGPRMLLLTVDSKALWVWRLRPQGLAVNAKGYDDGQRGVMCTVFRNEGPHLSSDLVREADELAWNRWDDDRHFTYVDATKTAKHRGKQNPPGSCFLMAGWHQCGVSKGGLILLEIWR